MERTTEIADMMRTVTADLLSDDDMVALTLPRDQALALGRMLFAAASPAPTGWARVPGVRVDVEPFTAADVVKSVEVEDDGPTRRRNERIENAVLDILRDADGDDCFAPSVPSRALVEQVCAKTGHGRLRVERAVRELAQRGAITSTRSGKETRYRLSGGDR